MSRHSKTSTELFNEVRALSEKAKKLQDKELVTTKMTLGDQCRRLLDLAKDGSQSEPLSEELASRQKTARLLLQILIENATIQEKKILDPYLKINAEGLMTKQPEQGNSLSARIHHPDSESVPNREAQLHTPSAIAPINTNRNLPFQNKPSIFNGTKP